MGVVLEAVDRRNGATCAVKLILPEAAANDPGLVDRMRLEAEVASTSHSPHIVRVFGSGRTQDGAPYYAMERLVGKTLRDLARAERPMHVGRALRFCIQLGDGLSDAHARGVVHRDIKPTNALVCDGSQILKILDFGIAKVVQSTADGPAPLAVPTVAGVAPGSLRWAAPEVLANEGIDASSDIYSSGLVLWSLIAGTEPWKDATTREALLLCQLNDPLPALATLLQRPELAELDRAIAAATTKYPATRTKDGDAFAADLRRVLRGLEGVDFPKVGAPVGTATFQTMGPATEKEQPSAVTAKPVPQRVTMPSLKRGDRFEGRYEIGDVLGQGGMGIVYSARQTFLGRDVAIKMIPLEASRVHAGLVDEFASEMQVLAKLKDRNIVEIYDGGVTSENMAFIVMELLQGASLRKGLLARQPLSNAKCCVYLQQVAKALSVIHAIPMIHRDIKPENIMVSPNGEVKIVDFGLARVRTKSKYVTRNPRPVGTIHYMPREQMLNAECDESVDVFAFGLMLFECFTGVHPRATQSGEFENQREAIAALVEGRALPSLLERRPDLPRFIGDIYMRCVDVVPERRPKAPELVAALIDLATWMQANENAPRAAHYTAPPSTLGSTGTAKPMSLERTAPSSQQGPGGTPRAPTVPMSQFQSATMGSAEYQTAVAKFKGEQITGEASPMTVREQSGTATSGVGSRPIARTQPQVAAPRKGAVVWAIVVLLLGVGAIVFALVWTNGFGLFDKQSGHTHEGH